MMLSGSRAAYPDCFDLFDRAMASVRGVQKICATPTEAYALQGRLNKARQLDRRENKRVYASDPEHFLYDNSEFYCLTIGVVVDEERGVWLVKLEKKQLLDGIEDIPEPTPQGEMEDDTGLTQEDMEPSPPQRAVGARRF